MKRKGRKKEGKKGERKEKKRKKKIKDMERIALLLVKLKPYAVLQLLLRCESTMQSIYIYHSDNHVNAHPDQFSIFFYSILAVNRHYLSIWLVCNTSCKEVRQRGGSRIAE